MFGNKWLGPEEQERRNNNDGEGPIPWPARSPDFPVNDFFLWGHVKGDVYKTRPADPDDLKDQIRQGSDLSKARSFGEVFRGSFTM